MEEEASLGQMGTRRRPLVHRRVSSDRGRPYRTAFAGHGPIVGYFL